MTMKIQSSFFLIFIALNALFFSAIGWGADSDTLRVTGLSGIAEFLPPGAIRWRPLSKDMVLARGTKVRTGDKSVAQILLEPGFRSGMLLREDSRLEIQDYAPGRFFLAKGAVFIIREEDNRPFPFRISARNAAVDMRQGGCEIRVFQESVLVKVFGDSVFVAASVSGARSVRREVKEGDKIWVREDADQVFQRMNYPDYVDWLAWVKIFYKQKDDFEHDLDWDHNA
jgi:ferric-dicitrate binding protein FerR (iron transport regulator)